MTSDIASRILPMAVLAPVPTTTARARPAVTTVPCNSRSPQISVSSVQSPCSTLSYTQTHQKEYICLVLVDCLTNTCWFYLLCDRTTLTYNTDCPSCGEFKQTWHNHNVHKETGELFTPASQVAEREIWL